MYLDTAKKCGEWLAGVNDVMKEARQFLQIDGLGEEP
jgi:hypothetical protein